MGLQPAAETTPEPGSPRFGLVAEPPVDLRAAFAESVRQGLTAEPRQLACRWLYDARGSRLFEQICELPEYYVTRAEAEILRSRSAALAARLGPDVSLVELGSGSASKTRMLIEAILATGRKLLYVPVDISRTALEASARELLAAHPELHVLGLAGDYEYGLGWMAVEPVEQKLVLFLGGNIGNLDREAAARFLTRIRERLGPRDLLLLGIDLRKSKAELEAAYDDAAGVTAEFNLNLLGRINRELGGQFELDGFAHEARYDELAGKVVLNLVSLRDQRVRIEALDLTLDFAEGERIHTEDSTKYSPDEIEALARASGFALGQHWVDAAGRFSLNLFEPQDARA